jgi:hypothetical protein
LRFGVALRLPGSIWNSPPPAGGGVATPKGVFDGVNVAVIGVGVAVEGSGVPVRVAVRVAVA